MKRDLFRVFSLRHIHKRRSRESGQLERMEATGSSLNDTRRLQRNGSRRECHEERKCGEVVWGQGDIIKDLTSLSLRKGQGGSIDTANYLVFLSSDIARPPIPPRWGSPFSGGLTGAIPSKKGWRLCVGVAHVAPCLVCSSVSSCRKVRLGHAVSACGQH